MKLKSCLPIALILTCLIGCQQQQADEPQTDSPKTVAAPQPDTAVPPPDPKPEDAQQKTSWEKVNQLYQSAKASGQTTASSAKEWLTELYGDASSASKTAAVESADWLAEMYKKAKDSGETTATNSKEWLAEDMGRAGTWQYTTLVMDLADNQAVEGELNKLGAERWECYWVDKQSDRTTFYLKKQQHSYIRNLPIRQLLMLIPLLNMASSGD